MEVESSVCHIVTTNLIEVGFAQPEEGADTNVQTGNTILKMVLIRLEIFVASLRHLFRATTAN